MPLIDAHSHLVPIPGAVSGQELLSLLMDAGVSGIVLFGRPSDVQAIQQENPDYVFPFAQVRRDPSTRELLLDDSALGLIQRQFDSGVQYGIGELSLRHRPFRFSQPEGDNYPADGPVALQIYDLAVSYGVPVIVHFEHEFNDELERTLEHNRDTIIIWAHVGDAQPPLVAEMMRRHPNLHADISTRNPFYERGISIDQQSLTDDDGTLKEGWRTLFEEFPDRFLFGLDLGPPNRLPLLDDVVQYYRSVLAQLTPSTAEKIAYSNIRGLLGRFRAEGQVTSRPHLRSIQRVLSSKVVWPSVRKRHPANKQSREVLPPGSPCLRPTINFPTCRNKASNVRAASNPCILATNCSWRTGRML